MLQVQSFDIMDSAGVNALLSQYRLAKGASILVSDGKVCIPYEDGEPMNTSQKRAAIGEERNEIEANKSQIVHSQKVLTAMIADAKEREAFAHEKHLAATSNKALERKYLDARQGVDQLENQFKMNEHEITRLDINIEKLDEQRAALIND